MARGGHPIDSINIGVAGAGRMGQAVVTAIEREADMTLAGVWTRDTDIDAMVQAADVLIDFSLPGATATVLDAVLRHRKPLVCGVSGLDDPMMVRLDQTAMRVAVVYDRNMSLGIAVLEQAVRYAAATLGPDFAVEISETHHEHKKDAPSGTALKLGEAVAEERGESGTGSVRFEVERRGQVPGDHEVVMRSPSERLTFAHSVTTRQVFADGAVRAARWVLSQAPGRYQMRDVLFGS